MVTRCQEGAAWGGMPERALDAVAELTQGRMGLSRFRLATGFFQRVRGLLGVEASKEILLLLPCKDIHTVGMRYAIDVAFIDQSGTVVLARRDVGPGKRIVCKEATAVLERGADAQSAWYEFGDVLLMGCVSDVDREGTSVADRGCASAVGGSCASNGKGIPNEIEGEAGHLSDEGDGVPQGERGVAR